MTATQTIKTNGRALNSSFGMLIFLQIFAIVLCLGVPLSILAPVPLVLAILVFGRTGALFFAGFFLALGSYVLNRYATQSGIFFSGMHFSAILGAALISEVILRNINPVKGLIISGFIFVAVCGGLLFSFEHSGKISIKDQISKGVEQTISMIKENNKEVLEQSNEESRNLKSFISGQKEIVDWLYHYLPSILFVSVLFVLWICFYAVLRLSRIWRFKSLYAFGTRDLITFKTPDYFVYPLIASLVMYVGADYGFGKNAEVVGGNILYCLGIFYLFQGFGVYYDFLTFARIGGFFKSAIMFFTILAAHKFLAIIGMFDLWFDFRKYFTKKNNDEGDML